MIDRSGTSCRRARQGRYSRQRQGNTIRSRRRCREATLSVPSMVRRRWRRPFRDRPCGPFPRRCRTGQSCSIQGNPARLPRPPQRRRRPGPCCESTDVSPEQIESVGTQKRRKEDRRDVGCDCQAQTQARGKNIDVRARPRHGLAGAFLVKHQTIERQHDQEGRQRLAQDELV